MFNNLKRFYNQNRKKIWIGIIIIAFAFLMLQLVNTIAKNNNEKQLQELKNKATTQNSTQNTTSDGGDISSSGTTQNQKTNSYVDTINQFIDYCNKQDLENAYNMITNNCKEEMFSNIEIFKKIYYDNTFENKQKDAVIDKWNNNTYVVKLAESALATGKIANTKEEQKIDYITVVKDDNGDYKLNINSYIGYRKIEKTVENDGVTIEVKGKNTYIEYETYKIKVINNSQDDVILDRLNDSYNLYLEDSNGNKYHAYTSELTTEILNVSKGHTRQIDIKFLNAYSSNKNIKKIVFSDYRKGNQQSKLNISL